MYCLSNNVSSFLYSGTEAQIRMLAPNQMVVRAPNQVVIRNGGPVVYKRIRLQDSDSDDAGSPAKKVAPAPISPPVELTTSVRERRFRNMVQMFPDISPIVSIFYNYHHATIILLC